MTDDKSMRQSELAEEANLYYINPDSPGLGRYGQENQFRYQNIDGKEVAKELGNTPKVARTYYIHPAIPRTYEGHILIPHVQKIKQEQVKVKGLSLIEYAVETLLEIYGTS